MGKPIITCRLTNCAGQLHCATCIRIYSGSLAEFTLACYVVWHLCKSCKLNELRSACEGTCSNMEDASHDPCYPIRHCCSRLLAAASCIWHAGSNRSIYDGSASLNPILHVYSLHVALFAIMTREGQLKSGS